MSKGTQNKKVLGPNQAAFLVELDEKLPLLFLGPFLLGPKLP